MKETGDEVPLRHHSAPEKGWRVKLKTAAQASNQSYSFTSSSLKTKTAQSLGEEEETPQEMRESGRLGRGFIPLDLHI